MSDLRRFVTLFAFNLRLEFLVDLDDVFGVIGPDRGITAPLCWVDVILLRQEAQSVNGLRTAERLAGKARVDGAVDHGARHGDRLRELRFGELEAERRVDPLDHVD